MCSRAIRPRRYFQYDSPPTLFASRWSVFSLFPENKTARAKRIEQEPQCAPRRPHTERERPTRAQSLIPSTTSSSSTSTTPVSPVARSNELRETKRAKVMERSSSTSRKRTSDGAHALALATSMQVLPMAQRNASRSSSARMSSRLVPLPSSPGSEEADSNAIHSTARAPAAASPGAETPPVDDKVLRRRLQYKMHQRRHRAKQKAKIETLEHEVHGLLSDVASLEVQCKRLAERNVFAGRTTPSGQPARIVLEYFRTYEHGWSPQRYSEQEHFLQCVMKSSIEGPDYMGVDFVKYQWRLYGHYFASTQYTVHGYDVSSMDDMTIVIVDATMCFRPRRDGVTTLCPSLHGQEDLIQDVIGNAIVVPGKYRFIFDSAGRVSWFGADLDFVTGLQRTFGSLEKVAAFMRGANMSFGTGQIQCEPMDAHNGHSQQQRHHLEYLLS